MLRVQTWIFLTVVMALAKSSGADLVSIPAGQYKPLLGKGRLVQVSAFAIEENAVSNRDFLQFVSRQAQWQKTRAKSIFADKSYLKNWQGDLELGVSAKANSPVVYV